MGMGRVRERERVREIRGRRGEGAVWWRRRRRGREGCSRDLLRISASPFVHDISEDNPVIFSTRKLDKLLRKVLCLERKKKKKKTRVPRFIDLDRAFRPRKRHSRLSIPPSPFFLTLVPPPFLPRSNRRKRVRRNYARKSVVETLKGRHARRKG